MYSFTSRTNRLTHGAAFQLALLSNTCAHRAVRRVGLERARARVVCGVRGAAATSHGAVAPAASWCPCPTIVRSPGADVAGVSPVLVQMRQASAKPRCRCGRAEPSPGADVAGVSPVPVKTWAGCRFDTQARRYTFGACVRRRNSSAAAAH
jgi:hypothetical protein